MVHRAKRFGLITTSLVLVLAAATVRAEPLKGQDQESRLLSDHFGLSVGALAASFNTEAQIGIGTNLGTFIRLESDLGLDESLTVGWAHGFWRFNRRSALDFGYGILYTTSASRWLDGYFSVGYERDRDDRGRNNYFWTAESGFKFRANIKHSPLSFLSKLTDFWGLRVGLQAAGLLPVERWRYVIEIGAGTW